MKQPYHAEQYVECYPQTVEFWRNLLLGKGLTAKAFARYFLYLGEREYFCQDHIIRNLLRDLDKLLAEYLAWNLGETETPPTLLGKVEPMLEILEGTFLPVLPTSVSYTVSENPKNIIAKW